MYSLRPARETDQPRIRQMVRAARLNPSGLDWERFVVAEAEKGEIVGCGQVKRHRDGSAELASLVTKPGWRGHGVARAIIAHFQGAYTPPLYLMCLSSMRAFYERFGFRVLGVEATPRYFRRVMRLGKAFARFLPDGEFLLVMVWNPHRD